MTGRPPRRRWGFLKTALVGLLALAMLFGLAITVLVVSLWFPTDPPQPTVQELDQLAREFPALHAALDSIAAVEVERWKLWRGGHGEAYRREVAPRHHELSELERGIRARAGLSIARHQQSRATSDSLVCVQTSARRGWGFGAGWAYRGYIRAARDPSDRRAWLPEGPPQGMRIVHLDGDWYAYIRFRSRRSGD